MSNHDKPEWEITVDLDNGFAAVKTAGRFNKQQVEKMTNDTFQAAADQNLDSVLGDHRQMTTDISMADLYFLPRNLQGLLSRMPKKIAIVLLETSSEKDSFDFFRTTAFNVGIHVQLFTETDKAKTWLTNA